VCSECGSRRVAMVRNRAVIPCADVSKIPISHRHFRVNGPAAAGGEEHDETQRRRPPPYSPTSRCRRRASRRGR
jgi:hypothetical protein